MMHLRITDEIRERCLHEAAHEAHINDRIVTSTPQTLSERGMTIIFNPSPVNSTLNSYPLACVDWFLLNEIEGKALTQETEPKRILAVLKALYPNAGIVLTLGEDGAYCMRGDEILYQPAFPVQPVDTTAAGDTFTGYFVTGLSHDEDLSKVMERAAKAAAIAVSRAGAAESIPYANEV